MCSISRIDRIKEYQSKQDFFDKPQQESEDQVMIPSSQILILTPYIILIQANLLKKDNRYASSIMVIYGSKMVILDIGVGNVSFQFKDKLKKCEGLAMIYLKQPLDISSPGCLILAVKQNVQLVLLKAFQLRHSSQSKKESDVSTFMSFRNSKPTVKEKFVYIHSTREQKFIYTSKHFNSTILLYSSSHRSEKKFYLAYSPEICQVESCSIYKLFSEEDISFVSKAAYQLSHCKYKLEQLCTFIEKGYEDRSKASSVQLLHKIRTPQTSVAHSWVCRFLPILSNKTLLKIILTMIKDNNQSMIGIIRQLIIDQIQSLSNQNHPDSNKRLYTLKQNLQILNEIKISLIIKNAEKHSNYSQSIQAESIKHDLQFIFKIMGQPEKSNSQSSDYQDQRNVDDYPFSFSNSQKDLQEWNSARLSSSKQNKKRKQTCHSLPKIED